jgi:DNA helicase II / ATP-dependent DNA helicase PcrA
MTSRIDIACAGSGKTTALAEEAVRVALTDRVLIVTYTNENVREIRSKIIDVAGYVPTNIEILSWYAFLLRDGVRPYQRLMSVSRVSTIDFQTVLSRYHPADHYTNRAGHIFSKKVSEFVVKCDGLSNGRVVARLERIYTYLFIDEVQDCAGYDLDLLELFFKSKLKVICYGDPRQATFSTNTSAKNRQYRGERIVDWMTLKAGQGLFLLEKSTSSYRCNDAICVFADQLYPSYERTTSLNENTTGHDGIFFISVAQLPAYMEKLRPTVLRYSIASNTHGLRAFNIGSVKGKTFERVLIFPTKPMLRFIQTAVLREGDDVKKFYVAVTRARYSVAFVVGGDLSEKLNWCDG